MKQASKIIGRVEAFAEPLCAALGVELVEVRHLQEPGGSVLRIMIDREPPSAAGPEEPPLAAGPEEPPVSCGVTLRDCSRLSRDLSAVLDLHEDQMPAQYRLEVSSPGLDRPLAKPADYSRFVGREVHVKTLAPVDGRRSFQGELVGLEDGVVVLLIDAETYRVPYASVHRARLVHRF
jgi:ribosome maturation factor RimP